MAWARNTPPLSSTASGQAEPRVLLKESGEVARHRRVAGVGQAERDQAAARAFAAGSSSAATRGKKPSTTMRSTSSRRRSTVRAPPIRREPAPSSVTVTLSGASRASSRSLAARQRSTSCDSAPAGRRCAACGGRQLAFGQVREREVHVVAAEHQVAADRDAFEPRLAAAQLDAHQGEVGGAAADVAHQHQARVGQLRGQRAAVAEQPVVERRLRLLEQAQRAAGRRRVPPPASARARRRRTRPAPSARLPAPRAGPAGCGGSRRRARARG